MNPIGKFQHRTVNLNTGEPIWDFSESENVEIRKIQQLIANDFPKPPEIAALPADSTLEERQRHHDLTAAQFFDQLAHQAVNANEKRSRDWMKSYASDFLLHGKPLPTAARAWLLYVLRNLDDVPHAAMNAKGKPKNLYGHLCDVMALANFMANRNGGKVPKTLSAIDKDMASQKLHFSPGKVRKLFDSERFKIVARDLYS